jgi:hypothetical protein
MPAAVVEAPSNVTDEEAALVRNLLDRLDENQRRSLWSVLELVDQQIAKGADVGRIGNAIGLAPQQARATVADIAAIRLARAQTGHGSTPTSRWVPPPAGQTPISTIVGRACDHDCWTSSGWTWASFAPEALDRLGGGWRSHDPVPVLYRHGGEPLGLSTRLTLSDHGDLDAECMMLPISRAQWAARYIRDGTCRGLSVGVTIRDTSWTMLDPRDWQPDIGQLDMCRRYEVDLDEISLTPSPSQPGSTITAWW